MSIKSVLLRNGQKEPEPLVQVVVCSLQSLWNSGRPGRWAVYDLNEICQGRGHTVRRDSIDLLKEFYLLGSDGRVDRSIRNVVVSSIEGEGLEAKLVSPIGEPRPDPSSRPSDANDREELSQAPTTNLAPDNPDADAVSKDIGDAVSAFAASAFAGSRVECCRRVIDDHIGLRAISFRVEKPGLLARVKQAIAGPEAEIELQRAMNGRGELLGRTDVTVRTGGRKRTMSVRGYELDADVVRRTLPRLFEGPELKPQPG